MANYLTSEAGRALLQVADRFEAAALKLGSRGDGWSVFRDPVLRMKTAAQNLTEQDVKNRQRIIAICPPFRADELKRIIPATLAPRALAPVPIHPRSSLPLVTPLGPEIDELLGRSQMARDMYNHITDMGWTIRRVDGGDHTANPYTRLIAVGVLKPPNRCIEAAAAFEEIGHAYSYSMSDLQRVYASGPNDVASAARRLMGVSAGSEGIVRPYIETVRGQIIASGGPPLYHWNKGDPFAGETFDILEKYANGKITLLEAAAEVGTRRQFEPVSEKLIYHERSFMNYINVAQTLRGGR